MLFPFSPQGVLHDIVLSRAKEITWRLPGIKNPDATMGYIGWCASTIQSSRQSPVANCDSACFGSGLLASERPTNSPSHGVPRWHRERSFSVQLRGQRPETALPLSKETICQYERTARLHIAGDTKCPARGPGRHGAAYRSCYTNAHRATQPTRTQPCKQRSNNHGVFGTAGGREFRR